MSNMSKTYNHQQSSIEVGRTGKGTYNWSIKLYFDNEPGGDNWAISEIAKINGKLEKTFLTYQPETETKETLTTPTTPVAENKEERTEKPGNGNGNGHSNNGWATEKQINFLYAKARRLTGKKSEQGLEDWLISEAIGNKVISREKDLRHLSLEEASALIELLPK